jgi:hypothetical protein
VLAALSLFVVLAATAGIQDNPDVPTTCRPFGIIGDEFGELPPNGAALSKKPSLRFVRQNSAPPRSTPWQDVGGTAVKVVSDSQLRVWLKNAAGVVFRLQDTASPGGLGTLAFDGQIHNGDAEVCAVKETNGLVYVRYSTTTGMATSSANQVLIDVTAPTPRVVAALQWTWSDAVGACRVYDAGMEAAMSCQWDGSRLDFVCEEAAFVPAASWAVALDGASDRRFVRRSWLRSAAPVGGDEWIDAARLYESLVAPASHSPGKEFALERVGSVRLVSRIDASSGPAFILAAEGRDERLDARFLLLLKPADGPVVVEKVPSFDFGAEFDEKGELDLKAGFHSPTSAQISVGTALSHGNAALWPVLVSRAGHKTLYLVGAEGVGKKVIAGSFFLTTDAEVQGNCGRRFLPASGLDFRPAGPLAFNALVQAQFPSGHVASDPDEALEHFEDAPTNPHRRQRFGWASGKGFVYSEPEDLPPGSMPTLVPRPSLDFLEHPAARTLLGLPVETVGRGRPIVFLSTSAPVPNKGHLTQPPKTTESAWGDLRGAMEQLSREFKVVSVILPPDGAGSADMPAAVMEIFRSFGLRRAVVVAVGSARTLAVRVARLDPSRVAAVGLIGPTESDSGRERKGRVPIVELGAGTFDEIHALVSRSFQSGATDRFR